MITLSDINTAYKNATQEEKRKFLELILPDINKNPYFHTLFDTRLVISELKPIKRIAELETDLGRTDPDFLPEDREPTIPEQITELKERIENIESGNVISVTYKEPGNIIPETKTEARAVFLVQYLEKEVKERNGELFLNNRELKEFFTRIVPEKNPDCEVKEGQNLRKIKKDVLTKVKKLFGNKIDIVKNKHGRHETLIRLKPLPTVT
jgi:hypothetical protein